MKNWLLLSIIALTLLVTGCTGSSTAEKELPEDEQTLTWWEARTKDFGSYDYQATEEEAQQDLNERFDVELLPSFEQAQTIIEETFSTANRTVAPKDYYFYASNDELIVTNIIRFKGDDPGATSYGRIIESYNYLAELKKVKVASQRVELYNETLSNKYNGKELSATLTELGSLLKIDKFSDYLDTFKKETNDPSVLGKKDIVIYEDYKEGKKADTFGKLLGVKYDEAGIVAQIYAVTYDYRR